MAEDKQIQGTRIWGRSDKKSGESPKGQVREMEDKVRNRISKIPNFKSKESRKGQIPKSYYSNQIASTVRSKKKVVRASKKICPKWMMNKANISS